MLKADFFEYKKPDVCDFQGFGIRIVFTSTKVA